MTQPLWPETSFGTLLGAASPAIGTPVQSNLGTVTSRGVTLAGVGAVDQEQVDGAQLDWASWQALARSLLPSQVVGSVTLIDTEGALGKLLGQTHTGNWLTIGEDTTFRLQVSQPLGWSQISAAKIIAKSSSATVTYTLARPQPTLSYWFVSTENTIIFRESTDVVQEADRELRHTRFAADLLSDIRDLHSAGRLHDAIDVIYQRLEAKLLQGDLGTVKLALVMVAAADVALDILLSALTVTLPWRSELAERGRLIERVRAQGRSEFDAEQIEAMLTGLV